MNTVTCQLCEQGGIYAYVCGAKSPLVLLCEECTVIWREPANLGETPLFPCTNGFVAELDASIYEPGARWAYASEVRQAGWPETFVRL